MEDKTKQPMEQLELFQAPKVEEYLSKHKPKRLSKKACQKRFREIVEANSEFISRFSKEYLR